MFLTFNVKHAFSLTVCIGPLSQLPSKSLQIKTMNSTQALRMRELYTVVCINFCTWFIQSLAHTHWILNRCNEMRTRQFAYTRKLWHCSNVYSVRIRTYTCMLRLYWIKSVCECVCEYVRTLGMRWPCSGEHIQCWYRIFFVCSSMNRYSIWRSAFIEPILHSVLRLLWCSSMLLFHRENAENCSVWERERERDHSVCVFVWNLVNGSREDPHQLNHLLFTNSFKAHQILIFSNIQDRASSYVFEIPKLDQITDTFQSKRIDHLV